VTRLVSSLSKVCTTHRYVLTETHKSFRGHVERHSVELFEELKGQNDWSTPSTRSVLASLSPREERDNVIAHLLVPAFGGSWALGRGGAGR